MRSGCHGVSVNSLEVRKDVPAAFRTNYATALLACNHVAGAESVLAEIRDEQDPAVQQLRAAIARWAQGLSFWQRIRRFCGDQPDTPVPLDFPLGQLVSE